MPNNRSRKEKKPQRTTNYGKRRSKLSREGLKGKKERSKKEGRYIGIKKGRREYVL